MAAYDVIVAGLGAMGSAAAYHLAARGKRVLGLEKFGPGHAMGSSHGESRIIREMYFEHPLYVPLVQRAYELWRELEQRAGEPLIHIGGGLMLGPRDGMLVQGTLRSAAEHALPHQVLTPDEVRARFPVFRPAEGFVGIFDPRAGWLRPEACNAAHQRLAAARGAELRFNEPLLEWSADGGGVTVRTARGEHRAERLLLSAGGWMNGVAGDAELPLTVERQVLFWFRVAGDGYAAERMPIFAWEHTPGFIGYGFPRLEMGLKAALMHQGDEHASPDDVRRAVDPREVEPLRHMLRQILPEVAEAPVEQSAVCLFTNTPDHAFAIGFHPRHPRALLCSPCSGHGFKFAAAIGEICADLLLDGRARFDLAPFSLDRFG